MNFLIINGPNLNLLGVREKNIYGDVSFEACFKRLEDRYNGLELGHFQSNIEGELIDEIHRGGVACDGIVINAGGYAHTSVAIADAISAINVPVVSVHISNIHKREAFRHNDIVAGSCLGSISGFGIDSYRLAVEALLSHFDEST